MDKERFSRSAALLGAERMARLKAARVAVIGVGGVGGWCAEALVRTGVGRLVLVDDDVVQPSNLNRQDAALVSTLGAKKVEALKSRLAAVNPEAEIAALDFRFRTAADLARLGRVDCIVDAIDSVAEKAELILAATEAGIPLVSSMGAALRTDPTAVRMLPFKQVAGDGLARALRARFKRLKRFPAADFKVAASGEPPLAAEVRGSIMPVVAAFGCALAAETLGVVG